MPIHSLAKFVITDRICGVIKLLFFFILNHSKHSLFFLLHHQEMPLLFVMHNNRRFTKQFHFSFPIRIAVINRRC